ncbi:NFX1-type zinc finger-containing protein 1 [Grifola frondosa]|uniref:NFX1-type zinc finger-containing protein 1 n=1 Tax=Grifola frondosa TaxID=5627 RepID=A0A1C7LLK4_GRIFR|nr:NFX1-type zinc finger-containing protein 1 [Grifola frondosa]
MLKASAAKSSTTRSSIMAIHDDLTAMSKGSRKKKDRTKIGGADRQTAGAYRTSAMTLCFFQVYTNVNFGSVRAERRAITVGLQLDAPPGAPRDPSSKKRAEYWEHSKRLQGGNLVALVLIKPQTLRIFLGVITSSGKDIVESSKRHESRLEVRASFFDAEVELMALREEHISSSKSTFAILVDNGVMLESVRPFLERLQTIEPTEIPFVRYIAQNASLVDLQILPPRYATAPRFCFKLQCLAKPGQLISDLNISQPNAVTVAHRQLLRSSELDSSQVDALLAALTKEVALIQGPPGTGKSFTGKEILRVLFSSGIKPIVLIAYTNHAVDHMLTSILDAKVTEKIVRLGSRSSDERIAQYTLDNLDKIAAASSLDRSMKRQYAIMKQLEGDIVQVMDSIQLPLLTWDKVEEHLDIHFPDHAESLREPPYWIAAYAERVWADEEVNGDWTTVKKKARNADSQMDRTFYGFWKDGQDIQLIQPPPKPKPPKMPQSKDRKQQVETPMTPSLDPFVFQFFASLGFGTAIPRIPMTSRSLENLLERNGKGGSVKWRTILIYKHYEALRTRYKEVCDEYNDMKDESRRRLLSNTDLIACTTTGAAKVTSLLNSVAPKVLVVEEAGQVLEAHILTSLVPSGACPSLDLYWRSSAAPSFSRNIRTVNG